MGEIQDFRVNGDDLKGEAIEFYFTILEDNGNFKLHIDDYGVDYMTNLDVLTPIGEPRPDGSVFHISMKNLNILLKNIVQIAPTNNDYNMDIMRSKNKVIIEFADNDIDYNEGKSLEKCPECQGRGYTYCETCLGEGTIQDKSKGPLDPRMPWARTVDCPDCGGSGKVRCPYLDCQNGYIK